MALSNIFREPRREITETVVGLAIFTVFSVADSYFAAWFQWATGGPEKGAPIPVGYFFGAAAMFFGILILFAVHNIGEYICGALAARGLELRPKRRYR